MGSPDDHPTHPSWLQRLLRAGFWIAGVVALLPLPAAVVLDAGFSAEVQLLASRRPAEDVAFWRQIRAENDPVALIYGEPRGKPLEVLLLSEEGVIRPQEAPDTTLLYVDHARRSDPWTPRMAYHWALGIAGAAVLAALLLAGARRLLRRRARPATLPIGVKTRKNPDL